MYMFVSNVSSLIITVSTKIIAWQVIYIINEKFKYSEKRCRKRS